MTIPLIFSITTALLGLYIFYYKTSVEIPRKGNKKTLFILLVSGFILRIILAYFYKGHETDMSCFNAWSDMLKNDGFASFYTSDAFTDYPPGYMYILYLLSFVKNIFGKSSIFTSITLKLPSIISDILCGLLVYKLCDKHGKNNFKFLLTAFYVFNPTVILNSAVWGQVDSIFTLFIILMLFALTEKKMLVAYFVFGIAIFIKPQALFYAPVLFFGIIENVLLNDFSAKKFLTNLLGGLGVIAFICILMLPFGFMNVVNQYINTISSYNYASVNAYNLWVALGLNWGRLTSSISIIGYLFIILTVFASIYIFFYKGGKNRYFMTSAFICFSIFVLSIKMHERYAFPVMALLLCAYALSSKKEDMYLYLGISTLQFINLFHVLFFYDPATYELEFATFATIISWITVVVFVVFIAYEFKDLFLKSKNLYRSEHYTDNRKQEITIKDISIICILTLIYSAIALFNLGDNKAPQTFETVDENSYIDISFGEEVEISKFNLYIGAKNVEESDMLAVSFYNENDELTYEKEIIDGSVFRWEEFENIYAPAKSIKIASRDTVYVGEIGIFSSKGEQIYPIDSCYLTDEQDTVPFDSNYRNSTYFDEIYHARTAYEFIHGLPVYEWTHPPLGKVFISLGINTFGMTPFGWRIAGTLFGIMMVPLLYVFSKKMFGETWISTLTTIIFSFDFMYFTQSRIATIDVYVTFFIMMMYLFMYKYCDEYLGKKSTFYTFIPLALSGIFMGFGIASKWTGAYAGVGLAVIFFLSIFLKRKCNEITNKDIYKTAGFCALAFVIVPILIYVLSYIPFLRSNDGGLVDIVQNQIDMLTYHGKTVLSSEHPFSSKWFEWIVDYRPIWYYTGTNNNLTENISAFGNPIVWISGLLAFFFCLYDAILYCNKNASFLVISYLAQLLPWVLVERTTFIYHYFPCVPFLVLMIAHFVQRMYQEHKGAKVFYIVFAVVTVILFIMFYPAISGFPVSEDYVRKFLLWLPSWTLIS